MGSSSDQVQWAEDEAAYLAALQLVSHHGVAMAVKAAVELDVFNILARSGPGAQLSAGEIAAKIPNCVDPIGAAARLDRVLRFLASHAILRCYFVPETTASEAAERRYGLEPIYRLLHENQDGVSLAAAFLVTRDKASLDSWQYLKDAVLEEIDPFAKANGSKAFDYMAKDARFAGIFNKYMAGVTKLTSEKIVDSYKGFDAISTLVDVGGGVGAMLGMIISKHPHVKGINFDLPHVISSAPVISGVEHVAGDLFVSIPTGDAILLKWILHDWSDEECMQILKNCYTALPISGKAIVVEQILPENPERNDAVRDVYFMDLCMMVSFHHARERSEKEFRALASEAGFAGFNIAAYTMNYHVMEFIK
ncbi:Caffeic acid 3-O-methyltransferase [Platanthera zijinensis]|uniref:Caffeic acid 3-O-methyltransferase n=1 Tax=Platanthera zijinensis TaxID=2320716 RepID=A0AAP0BN30_9ASPA